MSSQELSWRIFEPRCVPTAWPTTGCTASWPRSARPSTERRARASSRAWQRHSSTSCWWTTPTSTACTGDAGAREKSLAWSPPASLAALIEEQARSDERFVQVIDGADDTMLSQVIELPRSTHVQREPMANVLAHLFNHKVHHRGQVHAMLSATAAKPPRLDELPTAGESHLRTDDLATLGWSEADLVPWDKRRES